MLVPKNIMVQTTQAKRKYVMELEKKQDLEDQSSYFVRMKMTSNENDDWTRTHDTMV